MANILEVYHDALSFFKVLCPLPSGDFTDGSISCGGGFQTFRSTPRLGLGSDKLGTQDTKFKKVVSLRRPPCPFMSLRTNTSFIFAPEYLVCLTLVLVLPSSPSSSLFPLPSPLFSAFSAPHIPTAFLPQGITWFHCLIPHSMWSVKKSIFFNVVWKKRYFPKQRLFLP